MEHSAEQAIVSYMYAGQTFKQQVESNFVNDVFNSAFGGGFHSILFDVVREKLGLCYSIGSCDYGVGDSNRTIMYTMLNKDNVEEALEAIDKCFKDVQENGINDELLTISKKSISISVASSAQTCSGYASNFLDCFFAVDELISIEDSLRKINSIQNSDVIEFARWLGSNPRQLITMNV